MQTVQSFCGFVCLAGLENSNPWLVFMIASGCRASEDFDISSENIFFPYMPIPISQVLAHVLFSI